ncbi:MAG: hypothetical protein DRQ40_00760, partial [Gammaproteobacteria bacterium]
EAAEARETADRIDSLDDRLKALGKRAEENRRARLVEEGIYGDDGTVAKVLDLDEARLRRWFREAGEPEDPAPSWQLPQVATGTAAGTGTGFGMATGTAAGTGTGLRAVPPHAGTDITGGRKLTMGAAADAVDPFGNETILGPDDMDNVIRYMRGSLDDIDSTYSEEAIDDFVKYLKLIQDDGEEGALFAEIEQFIFTLKGPIDIQTGRPVALTKWETFEQVVEQLEGLKINRATGVAEVNGVPLVPNSPESTKFIWSMLAIEPEFWEKTGFWQDVIGFGSDTDMIFRHLPPQAESTYERGQQAARLWKNLMDELQTVSDGIGTSQVHFGNLRRSLDEIYGAANVSVIGDAGVNGEIFKVIDGDGRVFLIKPLTSGHGGEPYTITLSHGVSDFIGSKLDDIPISIETRVIPLSEQGEDYIAVMPYFVGDQISEAFDEITAEGMSRLNLFDRLVMEADPNTGNSMVNRANRRAVSIDTESSFALLTIGEVHPGIADRVVDYGFNGELPSIFRIKNIEDWVGGTEVYRRATNAPALTEIKLTLAEQDFLVPRARRFVSKGKDGFAGGVNVDGVNGGATIEWKGLPTLVRGDKASLIGGRATVRTGNFTTYMEVTHFATPKEAELLRDMLARNLDDELADVIRKRVGELSETSRSKFIDLWEPGGTLDEAIDSATAHLSGVFARRAEYLLDNNIVNTTGGITKHVADDGTVYEIGKKIDIVRTTEADQWNPMHGIVTDIFDDAQGRRQIVVANEMGQGHSTKQLEAIFGRRGTDQYHRGPRTEIYADEWSDAVTAERIETNTFVEAVQEKLDTKHVRRRTSDSPRDVDVHVYDAEGVPVGFRTENVQVHVDKPGRSGVRFRNETEETVVSWEQIIDSGKVDELVDAELAKMAPADRPMSVVVHFAPIRDSEGDIAFGYIRMDERQLHITVQSATQLPSSSGPVTGRTAISLARDADLDDVESLIDTLDWDGFTLVLRHELSHSMDSGREATQRSAIAKKVVQELLDEYPDVDSIGALDDLLMYTGGVDLIPKTYVPSRPDMSVLAQLVEYRVELVEDVINTQLVRESKEVLQATSSDGSMPSWMQKAYKGIREGDPDAHHEFIAEIYTRILGVGKGATAAEIDREVWSLFANKRAAKKLLSRSDIPLPKSWYPNSPEFVAWLQRYTDGEIIPRHRSTNTKFYHEEISGKKLAREISEALEAGAEEVGGTTHLTGFRPDTGFAVARSGSEEIVKLKLDVTPEMLEKALTKEIDKYLKANRKRFLAEDDWYFGYWLEPAKGADGEDIFELYLDVTRVIDDELDAAYFGYREQQKAMYRLHDGGETIRLTDETPDFKMWLNTHYPDMTEHQLSIMLNRIGASRTKVSPTKDIVEVIDKRGRMVPISLEWMTKAMRERLQHSYMHEYWYAQTKIAKTGKQKGKEVLVIVKDKAVPLASRKKVVVTKKRIKKNFERILKQASEYIGEDLVPDSLPDKSWLSRRRVKLTGAAEDSKETISALRRAFKTLDENMLLAPYRFELDEIPPNKVRLSMARTQDEVVLLKMGMAYDPDGLFGKAMREMGFNPVSKYAAKGDQEFFAESVLAVLTGRASDELTAVVIDLLPENQSLRRRHEMRFYQAWNGAFKEVASNTGISVDRIVANAAILSAGMDATVNRAAGVWMAQMVSENHLFTAAEAKAVRAYFTDQIEKRTKDLKPNGNKKTYEKKLAEIAKFKKYRGKVKGGMRLDEAITNDMGAHMLQGLTNTVTEQVIMPNGATRKLSLTGRYGMPQVERGYAVLTGNTSVNDALGDTKIRSFFNNILDPKDWYAVGDVTVDFHMANMALWVLGMQLPTANSDSPKILGMAAGLRPIVGDALRELFADSEWGTILDADSPAELQELLWEIWRLGFEKENEWWGTVPQATKVPYDRLVAMGWKPPLEK